MTDTPRNTPEPDPHATEPADPDLRKRSYWFLWLLLVLLVLLAAWYWYSQRTPELAPAPPVEITSPAEQAADADRISRPAREPRPESRPDPEPGPMVPPTSPASPLAGQSPAPTYPIEALRVGESGSVLLLVEVGADGRPGEIEFANRSGSRELDQAALEAVRQWRFAPAMRDGEPVASTVEVPVEFKPEQ